MPRGSTTVRWILIRSFRTGQADPVVPIAAWVPPDLLAAYADELSAAVKGLSFKTTNVEPHGRKANLARSVKSWPGWNPIGLTIRGAPGDPT